MGYLEQALAALDSARRTGGRNIQDLFSDPSAYAEKIAGHLRNTNAGVTPVATATELTNRPLTMEERVNDTLSSLDFGGGMGVIKPKGGNWLSGRYGPEAQLKSLKRATEVQIAPESKVRAESLNSWIDNQLTKYVKNDMAAPTDPIRKLADAWPEEKAQKLAVAEARVQKLRQKQQAQAATRGVPEEYLTQTRQEVLAAEEARDLIAENKGLHYEPAYTPDASKATIGRRMAAGFPKEGLGQTDLARAWENTADSVLGRSTVSNFQLPENLKADPWLSKADPTAPVYNIRDAGYEPGFAHITDELANSLREGRLTPEQLAKMPIDQAVRHVAEINALRKVTANKQQAMDASEIPVFKDYPEQGMSWRQLHDKDTDKLQKWLTQEGDSMGHCVGGYCDDVAEGRSQIYSLRDDKGRPHVTIETDPGLIDMAEYSGNNIQGMMNQEDAIAAIRQLEKQRPDTHGWNLSHWVDDLKSSGAGVPRIVQIKGPNNATPDPKYFPLIQDFIRSGKWSDIRDVEHTGLTQEEIDAILKR